MRASTFRRTLFVPLVAALMLVGLTVPAHAETDGAPGADPSLYAPPFSLGFPLEGSYRFSDTFGAIRDDGGRLHKGNDISAPKTTPVRAAASGVVSRVGVGDKAGLYVEIRHAEGWRTLYLHLNNDVPPPPPVVEPVCEAAPVEGAAADGATTGDAAAADVICTEVPVIDEPLTWGTPLEVVVGANVAAGDVIGFVGTSGNASSTAPHLHFEVRMPDGTPVNPYPILTGKTSPTTLYVLPDVTDDPVTIAVDVVSHVEPAGGFNADIWV
ncbi:MAG: M23 family metallopeptidase, partial [Acidimicrobiia bacterium]|nr:M23 family metallopeptidase [Acidimicrobiia bacterium]